MNRRNFIKTGLIFVPTAHKVLAQAFSPNDIILPVSSGSSDTLLDGLVGWWKFDEGSGTTAADSSGNGNHGTLINGPTWVAGRVGSGALSFSGSSAQYVDFGNAASLNLTAALTMACWVKFAVVGGFGQTFLNKNEGGGYGIICDNTPGANRIETFFYINGAYANAGEAWSNYSPGTWYHICATFDGVDTKFYRDGSLKQTVARSGTISTVAYPLCAGVNPGAIYSQYFNGAIDDARIYNRVLNSTEIAALAAM